MAIMINAFFDVITEDIEEDNWWQSAVYGNFTKVFRDTCAETFMAHVQAWLGHIHNEVIKADRSMNAQLYNDDLRVDLGEPCFSIAGVDKEDFPVYRGYLEHIWREL